MSTPGYGDVAVEYTKGSGPQFPLGSTVGGSSSSTPTGAPAFGLDGNPSTGHTFSGQVTARSASTTVPIPAAAAFSTANYLLYVIDGTAGGFVTVTAQTKGSFTFNSISGHVYNVFASGS